MDQPVPRLLARQDELLRLATERAETAYLKAVRQGLRNPAVLVLDVSSPKARAIARTSGRHCDVHRLREKARRAGGAPVAVWSLSGRVAADLLPSENRDTADVLREWPAEGPPNTFPVVVVGAGIVSLAAMPAKHIYVT